MRRPHRAAPLAASLLSMLAAGGARAEEPEPPKEQVVEEVEVSAHYESSVGSTEAASAGAVTRQLVEDRPILRPGEVLELVPGLVITQHSGAGKANQYYLRGFNLDHGTDFQTNLDGVPLNLRTHAHGQGYTDLNFLIPELVDRVEYWKGPYFASRGDFASAGAADIHYAERLPASLAELTGGTFGYLRGVVAASPELAGGRLLVAGEYMHDDGPWVHADDYRRLNGVVRYTHPLAQGTWDLTGMAYRGTWDATDQIPQRALDDGSLSRFDGIDHTTGGDTTRLALSTGFHGPAGGGTLVASAYAVRYRLDLFSNFTYFLDDPLNGDQMEQADDRWMYGTSGSYARTFAGALTHTVTAGWEARVDALRPVALYHTAARVRLDTVRRDQVTESSAAAFAQVETTWSTWLRTLAGIRYDLYHFDVGSSVPENSGTAGAGIASPKVTAVLGPWAATEGFANFGFGFHSNDARGTTMRVDPSDPSAPADRVTPLVRTWGAEVGARTEVVPHVQTSLALWRLDIASELLFVGDAGTTEPSRPSTRRGVEWSTRWVPVRWLLFDLDVALSRSRFTDQDPVGDHIPGSIESAVSAGVTVHELGPFTAAVFLRYFGPRPLIEDDSVRSTASTIFNAQASWRFGRHLRANLEVLNALDAKVDDVAYYYTSRLPGEPAGGVDDVHVHPAISRTVRVSLAATY